MGFIAWLPRGSQAIILHLNHPTDQHSFTFVDTKRVDTIIEAVELIGIALHLDALHQLALDIIDLNQRHALAFNVHLIGGRVRINAQLTVVLAKSIEIIGTSGFTHVGNTLSNTDCTA